MELLDVDHILHLFGYDPERGTIWYRNAPNRMPHMLGKPAGNMQSSGRINIMVKGRLVRGADVAWVLLHGRNAPKNMRVNLVNWKLPGYQAFRASNLKLSSPEQFKRDCNSVKFGGTNGPRIPVTGNRVFVLGKPPSWEGKPS